MKQKKFRKNKEDIKYHENAKNDFIKDFFIC